MNKLLLTTLFVLFLFAVTENHAQVRYQGETLIGYSVGVGRYPASCVNIETKHGTRWSPYFYTGLGGGVQYYTGISAQTTPFYVNLKAYMRNGKVTPYVSGDVGYTIGYGAFQDKLGLYVSPAIGVSIGGKGNAAFIFEICLQAQRFTELFDEDYKLPGEDIIVPVAVTKKVFRKGISFKIGLSF